MDTSDINDVYSHIPLQDFIPWQIHKSQVFSNNFKVRILW